MNLRILRPALDDLAAGRLFYEAQRAGIGAYFFDSLFSEIDSLILHAGIHPRRSATIECSPAVSPTQFITSWNETGMRSRFSAFSIAGAIPDGLAALCSRTADSSHRFHPSPRSSTSSSSQPK